MLDRFRINGLASGFLVEALKVKSRPSQCLCLHSTWYNSLLLEGFQVERGCAAEMSSPFGMNGLRNIINVRNECQFGGLKSGNLFRSSPQAQHPPKNRLYFPNSASCHHEIRFSQWIPNIANVSFRILTFP